MNSNILVRIISGDKAFTKRMSTLLSIDFELNVYSGVDDFLRNDPYLECPGCILLDVSTKESQLGQLLSCLSEYGIYLPIICFGPSDIDYAVKLMKSGVAYYFSMPKLSLACIRIIRQEIDKCLIIRRKNDELAEINKKLGSLSNRERQVIDLASLGLTSKEIAKQLDISYRTVQTHRRRIYDKLGTGNLQVVVNMLYQVHQDPVFHKKAWDTRQRIE